MIANKQINFSIRKISKYRSNNMLHYMIKRPRLRLLKYFNIITLALRAFYRDKNEWHRESYYKNIPKLTGRSISRYSKIQRSLKYSHRYILPIALYCSRPFARIDNTDISK